MSLDTESVRWRSVSGHSRSAMPPAVEEFFFEDRIQLAESDFVALQRAPLRSAGSIRLGVLGIACLFWSYTMLLGMALLIGTALALSMRWLGPWSARRTWNESQRHLHGPVSFGVSHRRVWLQGDGLRAHFEWSRLSSWRVLDGWLQLSSICAPVVYLRVDSLKQAGVYEAVLKCVEHVAQVPGEGEEGRS